MHLKIAELEPCPAASAQLLRLGNFAEAEHPAIKGEALRFQRARHGDLHMIDAGNAWRHSAILRPLRSLATMDGGC